MINRLREAGLLWSGMVAVVAFFILIALGNWQWQRMHWKAGLLKQLERAAKAEPTVMRIVPPGNRSGENLQELQFRRIIVEGEFEHEFEFHVWSPAPSGPAWSVVTPLRLEGADTAKAGGLRRATHLLAIRGIVPASRKSPIDRADGQVIGKQRIAGRIRLDNPNQWANKPDINKNEWFTRDLAAMAARIPKPVHRAVLLAPFFLEVEQQIGGPTAPQPNLKAVQPTNRHLEYALTWWGLAATLAAVFGVAAWSRLNGAKS